jgi:hypothetical protein
MPEKVFLPSRIRRGRASTTPVWYAVHAGRRLQFSRKKDALAYEANGCANHKRFFCECHGWEPQRDALAEKVAQVVREVAAKHVEGK